MTQAAMTFTLTGPDPLMSGLWRDLNANGFTVTGLKAPVNSNDAARKADVTAVSSSLAPVATSGAYADLTGKPTLGTAAALNTGTGNGNIPVLGASGLPAIGGALLTGITKGQVGLGNVDNTADTAKPISVLQQAALDLKATTSSLGTAAYLNIGTASGNIPQLGASGLPAVGGSLLTGLTKGQVGLGNVDNTSDSAKNSATATLTNKTLTAPVINSPTGIVKGDVGLGNVDNTSDSAKNSATATLTNKTLTSPVINSPTGLVKADVGLGSVDNTSDLGKPISTAAQSALDAKAPLNSPVLVTPTLSAHPTASDNTLKIPTTKWVNDAISGAVASGVADGDKGDIVVSSSGTVWTLDTGTASALKDRANQTGTQSADTITDGTTNKAYTATEKTKLAGIPSDATNNVGTVTSVTVAPPSAGISVTNGTVSGSGTIQLGLQNDLGAVEALATNGIAVRTATSVWATRTITAPAAGVTVTNGDGVSGNPALALANDLAAVEGLSGTGLAVRTATDTWAQRSVASGSGITVTNGDGVSGNPTVAANAASTTAVGVVELATAGEFRALTAGFAVSTDTVSGAMAEVTLTDAATVTWDMSAGIDFVLTTTSGVGNSRTLGNPTNVTVGKKGRIRVVQDATGGRGLAISSNLKTQNGAGISLTATASAEDCIYYDAVSSTKVYLSPTKNWS